MLADGESQVRSIFRHNCDDEIQHIYIACFHLDTLPCLEQELLKYETLESVANVWDLLKSTARQWFQGDSLTTINFKLTDICDLIARRSFVHGGFSEREQLKLVEGVQDFITLVELPKMFNDETSYISSVYMRMDLGEIERIYRLYLKLTNIPNIETEFLKFEVAASKERMVALFEMGKGKWFTELYLAKFDKELDEGYNRMANRVYIHPTKARRVVTKHWLSALRKIIIGEVQRMPLTANSEISVILRRKNVEEVRLMYEICHELLYWNPGPHIFDFQVRMDRAWIRECIQKAKRKSILHIHNRFRA